MAKTRSKARKGTMSEVIRAVIREKPKATLKAIQAVLQARGVKASDSLVNRIKYGRRRSGGRKRAHKRRNGPAALSKADAIRETFAELGRRARPRDVVARLKLRGIDVTSAQVSMLRRKLPKNGAPRGAAQDGVSFDHLLAAKQFAQRLGGVRLARAAINSLARLTDE